jgi:autotransporter-associated beta strand protein
MKHLIHPSMIAPPKANHPEPHPRKTSPYAFEAAALLFLSLSGLSGTAATITKADTPDTMNLGTSWVGGVVPTSSDTALFDSTVSAGNANATLGADLSFLGLQITSPGGLVTINAGNTLTLGASGIDMSAASQGLALACPINFGASQIWNVGAGRGLTNSGLITGVGPLVKVGAGTMAINIFSNTYSGGTFLAGGTNVVGSVANGHFSSGSVTITNGATLLLFSGNSGDPGGGGGSLTNAIIVPAGQTANVLNHWRGGWSSPVSGGGTLNVRVNGTRGDISGSWSGFTNQLNLTPNGAGADFRIALGGTTNASFINAKVNLADGVFAYQSVNPPNGGVTGSATFQQFGALSGSAGAVLQGNPVNGRFNVWQAGFLNTDATFAGTIRDGALTAPTSVARVSKAGTGSWTLSGTNSYSGATTVLNGKLVEVTGGSASNSLSTTAFSGATLGVLVSPNGPQWVGTNMIFASSSGLEINYAGSTPNTAIAPLFVRGNLSLTSSVSIKILGGNWSVGAYPLVKYSTITNGSGFAALTLTALPLRVSGVLSNDTANSSIDLVVTSTTQPLRWAAGNGTWDVATSSNWLDAASAPTSYQQSGGFGDSVLFEDSVSVGTPITVSLNTSATPAGATFSASKTYSLSGAGSIDGFASLTKAGSGLLTVSLTNSFTGGVNVNGGVLNFSTLANLGNSPIIFGGGTLQWASGNTADISSRGVTFGPGSGTIDTGGNNVLYATRIGNNGTGGMTKTGLGTLTLSGANNYSGATIINQGTLALATGAGISNSVSIVVSNGANLDATASGLVLNGAVGQTIGGNGTVNGSVTAVAGSSISPGASPGTLTFANDLTINGGALVMDVSTNTGGRDLVVVGGTTTFNGGSLQLVPGTVLTNGTYRLMQVAGTVGSPGTLLLSGFAQSGQIAFLSDATPGEIDLIVANGGTNNLFWNGTSSSWDVGSSLSWSNAVTTLSSVFNQGDTVTFDDSGAGNPSVGLAALIYPSSTPPQRVTVTGSTSYTMSDTSGNGSGRLIGPTSINKSGAGTLTLLTVNNNTGPTVITAGTVQVGNGSTTGNLGFGNVTNNASLVFAQPDDRSINGSITGSGALVQQGAAVLTLTKDSSYTGPTTVSSGTLQVGTGGTTGTLGTGPITNAGTLIINRSGSLTVASGINGTGSPNPANLIKNGPGTLTLGGINTYEGNTYISNGVVKLGASEVIPDGGATTGWLILDGGPTVAGTLDMNGFNETVNSLSGLGGTVLGRIMNNTGSATNTLTVSGTASTTFAGIIQDNSGTGGKVALVMNGAGPLNLTGGSTYSGGTIVKAGTLGLGTGGQAGTASISLSNGTALNLTANGVSVFPGNDIFTAPDGTVSFLSANLANGIGGNFISGNTNSTNLIAGPISASAANFMQFSNFAGTVFIEDGFQLRFSSTTLTVNGGSNTTFIVGNASTLNTRNGTGQAAGSGIYLGSLLGPGILGGAGNADGASVYVIGGKSVDCIFSGTINGVAPRSTFITKVGTATLTLEGTLSHEGSTVVSNGVLKIASTNNTSTSLDTSTNIVVRAGAILDVSDRSDATLNLNNVQTVSGSGTIRGSLNAIGSSVVSPGDSVGILTVTNTATLGATVSIQLSRTNSPNSGRLVAPAIILTSGAALTVTNIGQGVRSGDTFQLFSGPITGTFTTVSLPALSPCLGWDTSQLYTLGRISVTGSVCPPSITSQFIGPNTLALSWPSTYLGNGWSLQAQTNPITVGLSTNWVTVAGSGATNQVFMTIVPTNGCVFYRMTY